MPLRIKTIGPDGKEGNSIECETHDENPTGTTYVRIYDPTGYEIACWDEAEWYEDPIGVMGAIMGALRGGSCER